MEPPFKAKPKGLHATAQQWLLASMSARASTSHLDNVISQSHCVEKIIDKFGYQNSRIAKTPYDYSVVLFKNESGVSTAQLRVLRYLKGTMSLAIHYDRFLVVLEGYNDAS
ncbi:hypothetical protein Sango_0543500 [Sesamum angolense]|uniref:Uncharacterized protein n=1 Tax=Sesamum angolense TaxID=2727404 RepID=A0AAE1X4Z8_9LAMI|nr:hypothetical protein Sango_0543500 [Sesamum angolense]